MPSFAEQYAALIARKTGTPPAPSGIAPTSTGPFWWLPGGRVTQSPSAGHEAIDIAAPLGTPIYAPVGGVIEAVKNFGSYGYGENIRELTPSGAELIFGHLSAFAVTPGEQITAGELLGRVGSTGYSTGPHTHFEARWPGPDVFTPGARSTTSAFDPYSILGGAAAPLFTGGGGAVPQLTDKRAQLAAIIASPGGGAERSVPLGWDSFSAPSYTPGFDLASSPLQSAGSSGASAPQAAPDASAGGIAGALQSLASSLNPANVVKETKSQLQAPVQRVGLVFIGSMLVVVGVVIFALASREQIGKVTRGARDTYNKVGATAAKAAALAA